MTLGLSSADGGMTVGLWKLSSVGGRRPPWYRPQEVESVSPLPSPTPHVNSGLLYCAMLIKSVYASAMWGAGNNYWARFIHLNSGFAGVAYARVSVPSFLEYMKTNKQKTNKQKTKQANKQYTNRQTKKKTTTEKQRKSACILLLFVLLLLLCDVTDEPMRVCLQKWFFLFQEKRYITCFIIFKETEQNRKKNSFAFQECCLMLDWIWTCIVSFCDVYMSMPFVFSDYVISMLDYKKNDTRRLCIRIHYMDAVNFDRIDRVRICLLTIQYHGFWF